MVHEYGTEGESINVVVVAEDSGVLLGPVVVQIVDFLDGFLAS